MIILKKIMLLLVSLVLMVGCSCSNDLAADAVEEYLNAYKNLSVDVEENINTVAEEENLTDDQKEVYKKILERQYRDLLYTIENETYNGDNAVVTVKITVYDLYKAQVEASEYLANNRSEFLTDGVYDEALYMDYKLDCMLNTNDTIDYTITFNVTKTNGNWSVEQPSDTTLEKIHGIYNYS